MTRRSARLPCSASRTRGARSMTLDDEVPHEATRTDADIPRVESLCAAQDAPTLLLQCAGPRAPIRTAAQGLRCTRFGTAALCAAAHLAPGAEARRLTALRPGRRAGTRLFRRRRREEVSPRWWQLRRRPGAADCRSAAHRA